MDPKLEKATLILGNAGFDCRTEMPPDQEHFGNWMILATRSPIALRVTSDRGDILLDLTNFDMFNVGAAESEWYNWDVVARAIGIEETGVNYGPLSAAPKRSQKRLRLTIGPPQETSYTKSN